MKVETYLLSEHDWVPNNARLPTLIYRHALDHGSSDAVASAFEAAFQAYGWPPQWRDGIYDYHHYHSTAHEALGIAAGSASLVVGGPDGLEISVTQGDALILPAGTGHCSISASEDFLVVGAYPYGQDWDICRAPPTPAMRKRMAALPFPASDPLFGKDGPLLDHWR